MRDATTLSSCIGVHDWRAEISLEFRCHNIRRSLCSNRIVGDSVSCFKWLPPNSFWRKSFAGIQYEAIQIVGESTETTRQQPFSLWNLEGYVSDCHCGGNMSFFWLKNKTPLNGISG